MFNIKTFQPTVIQYIWQKYTRRQLKRMFNIITYQPGIIQYIWQKYTRRKLKRMIDIKAFQPTITQYIWHGFRAPEKWLCAKGTDVRRLSIDELP